MIERLTPSDCFSVSRFGDMSLCWSMDKVGPLARSAEDAALLRVPTSGEEAPIVRRCAAVWLDGREIGVVGERVQVPPLRAAEQLDELGLRHARDLADRPQAARVQLSA